MRTVVSAMRSRRAGVPEAFGELLARCWPLHPVVAVLLALISRKRFGQMAEHLWFPEFSRAWRISGFLANTKELAATYRPEDLWDYLRLNLEPAILSSPEAHRWAQAVSLLIVLPAEEMRLVRRLPRRLRFWICSAHWQAFRPMKRFSEHVCRRVIRTLCCPCSMSFEPPPLPRTALIFVHGHSLPGATSILMPR